MIAMSEGLKDEAFLRNIADDVLNILNPPEPEHRDHVSPELESNGVEANHQTLPSGSTDSHPLGVQNGAVNSVEGSPARSGMDSSTSHTPDGVDSTAPERAHFGSQSRKSPIVLDGHDANRPQMNGISFPFGALLEPTVSYAKKYCNYYFFPQPSKLQPDPRHRRI